MMSKMKSTDRTDAPTVSTTAIRLWFTRRPRLFMFVLAAIVMWGLGTFVFIYFYPRLIYNALERTIVHRGLGTAANAIPSAGIPLNTLYAMPDLASPSTIKSNLLEGTNHDTLYTIGWLDLGKGPEVLHVPDMADRYYSIEFVDP
jgi:hypothetical protein